MTLNPFEVKNFEDFRLLAQDDTLSKYGRIGALDSYRQGFEQSIFEDICQKLSNLVNKHQKVVDIGPGCTDIPQLLMDLCKEQGHSLTLIDSSEMLARLPQEPFIEKIPGLFPPQCSEWIQKRQGQMDVILCYSVLHYVVVDTPLINFIDSVLSLLAPGGQILIGDIPNISMRNRFFASEAGVRCHQEFTKSKEIPQVVFNRIEPGKIDDGIIFGILQRSRNAGLHAYVIPQNPNMPLANRREDILIIRP